MKINNFLKLIIAIGVSELAGVIGSIFTMSAIKSGWYAALAKPALNPPAWVFGPVWIVLYFLMGVSAWLVWKKGLDQKSVKIALVIFDVQLALNIFWSIIFFGLRSPGWAFVEIIFFWFAILVTIILFAKVSRPAAWLLIPYIIWVSFAGYLNFSIWQLSKSDTGIACTLEAKLCPDGSAVGRTGPNCEFAQCPGIPDKIR
jgi:tryptophan-rich sensory protein